VVLGTKMDFGTGSSASDDFWCRGTGAIRRERSESVTRRDVLGARVSFSSIFVFAP
jgi:hypothetical protein